MNLRHNNDTKVFEGKMTLKKNINDALKYEMTKQLVSFRCIEADVMSRLDN